MIRDASRYLLVLLGLPCMVWSASALAYDRYPTNCSAEADRVARDNSSVRAGTRVEAVDLRYRNGFAVRIPAFREKAAKPKA